MGDSNKAGSTEYLTFMLAGQEYGVEILSVQEIKGWDRPTRIPNSPAHVLGVINLRGVVVPIIDLRRRFSLEAAPSDVSPVVVVVRVNTASGLRTAGIAVDAVSEVCRVSPEDLRAAPTAGAAEGGRIDAQCIKGLAIADGKMLILLTIDRLVASCLTDAEAAVAADAREKVA
jgi:purine-binding chemotaxis protein CheW